MVQSAARSVSEYLRSLPAERRGVVEAVRRVVLDNLGAGFAEGMGYGMIGYHVPHSVYPKGYHCDPRQPLPYAGIAAQKNHVSVYLMGLYMAPEDVRWFEAAWRAAGKKLDMGRCCVRFKRLEDVPLDVLAEAFRRMPLDRYVAAYEAQFASGGEQTQRKTRAKATKKAATKKAATKKVPATKGAAKKAAAKKPAARQVAAKKPVARKAAAKKAAAKK